MATAVSRRARGEGGAVARTGGGGGNDDVSNDREHTKRAMFGVSRLLLFRAVPAVLIITLVWSLTNHSNEGPGVVGTATSTAGSGQASTALIKSRRAPHKGFQIMPKYENCTISFQPPPARKEWDTKPLWLPAYPGSGAASASKKGDVLKPLIDALTGLKAGVKNYHMSGPRLKRCKGPSETAACSNGHPSISAIGPEKQTSNFHSNVIFVIRNFHWAFPAMFYDKSMAYHSATTQVDENKWRENRDTWIEGSIKQWLDMPLWWINATSYYNVALWVPFENLMDITEGPKIVEKLAIILKDAQFTVPTITDDIHCIWYKVMKKEYNRQKSFYEYVPGYTIEQRRLILSEIKQFMKQHSNILNTKAPEFVTILQQYYDDITSPTSDFKIDHPFDTGGGE